MPGPPVIRDLFMDMTGYFKPFHTIKPWLLKGDPPAELFAGLPLSGRQSRPGERLDDLQDPYRLFRCRAILNCTDICLKWLNPAMAIGRIKEMMVRRSV